nr:uncharacterized protein CI109_002770 [Kwoniella shandongensis]KAA5529012.1 hypothetical protein CI109_002770 [Kwoniella shandongensis]
MSSSTTIRIPPLPHPHPHPHPQLTSPARTSSRFDYGGGSNTGSGSFHP